MKAQFLGLALAGLATTVSAQDLGYDHGRVRFLEPGVTLQRATDAGAEEATPNTPFFPGDRVWTDGVGRAEFQFPDGSVVRLDSRSKLDYVAHEHEGSDESIVLRLWSGSLILHVRDGRRSPRFEVEAPGGLVTADARGVYRVDADTAETRLAVYDGEAVLDAARQRIEVGDGEILAVRRGESPEDPQRFDRDRLDDFAYWDRERAALDDDRDVRSARYLPAEVQPYARDFDEYGGWHYETEVGYVWVPTVQTGWRPYSNGRWCWTAYGWTWVPNEPWGFAPSHFGRWGMSAGLGWYWIPGGAWSPAWVSWAVGGDNVGWCPLGYRDRPVVGFDRWGHRRGAEGGRGGWTFARRGDLAARDLARRRLDGTAVELANMRVAESARARPTRDLRSIETTAVARRTGYERAGPRDTVPEMRADPYTTIPFPGAMRRDRDRDVERRTRYQEGGGETAEGRRGATGERGAEPRSRARGDETAARDEPTGVRRLPPPNEGRPASDGRPSDRSPGGGAEPTTRSRPPAEGGRPAPTEEARPRRREPDRDVMRQMFQPLTEPRSSGSGNEGGARARGESRDTTRDSSRGESRDTSRGESRGTSSREPRGGSEEQTRRAPPPRESSHEGSRPRGGSGGGGGESRVQSPAPRREPSRPAPPPPQSHGSNAERRKPPRSR